MRDFKKYSTEIEVCCKFKHYSHRALKVFFLDWIRQVMNSFSYTLCMHEKNMQQREGKVEIKSETNTFPYDDDLRRSNELLSKANVDHQKIHLCNSSSSNFQAKRYHDFCQYLLLDIVCRFQIQLCSPVKIMLVSVKTQSQINNQMKIML